MLMAARVSNCHSSLRFVVGRFAAAAASRCWLLVCVLLDYARYWTVLREAASLSSFVVELSN